MEGKEESNTTASGCIILLLDLVSPQSSWLVFLDLSRSFGCWGRSELTQ